MKTTTKRNLIATMFTTVLLLLWSFSAWAAEYNGSLDGMDDGSVTGWACNVTSPHTSASVQILVKNHDTKETTQDFTVFASEKRTDIKNEGKLNDYCGFSADIDWSSHPEALTISKLTLRVKNCRIRFSTKRRQMADPLHRSPKILPSWQPMRAAATFI
ncbi:hypothetical protein [Clostridium sp. AM58-1XD]|uniref:hypothetical protein n=1 Tax=Clostridium sp. AM58-1XD TaxID=2292307 RepID=UPI001FA83229|nr:hypothetical protein [Clostridium sp. AM58-1XD]